MFLRGCFV